MKKPTLVLSALLFGGLASIAPVERAHAQPVSPSYEQTLAVAKGHFESQDYEAMEKDARSMILSAASSEEIGGALLLLGETFYQRKMYEPARLQWSKMLVLPGIEADEGLRGLADLNMARSYSEERHFEKAIPHYKAGIAELQRDDDKVKAERGEAEVKFSDANPIFSLALANAYYHTRQYDLAQQELEPWTKFEHKSEIPGLFPLVHTRVGQIDFKRFRFTKSIASFEQVLASKEEAPKLKAYAQKQIEWANGMLAVNKVEKDPGNVIFELDEKSDNLKIDAFIQTVNDIIMQLAIRESLSEL